MRLISLDEAGRLAGLLGLIADPVRSRLLFALAAVERLCVGDLALALEVSDDAVSYGLRLLRTAGLVTFRRKAGSSTTPSPPRSRIRCSNTACASSCRWRFPRRTDDGMRALRHALLVAGSMTWEILWALILGFALASIVQSVVRRSTIERLLGDDGPRALAVATGLGAASSSCSYAAVALARALFRRGASFTAAMVFEIASTNLVVELGIILALLLGWQFTLAEFVGGPVMIVLLALWFRLFVRGRLLEAARAQADKGLAGSMEGHAAMDMSIQGPGSLWRRLRSAQALTVDLAHLRHGVGRRASATSSSACSWPERWRRGFPRVSGAISSLPVTPLRPRCGGLLIGPAVSLLSFVCSIGNVPLAAVLWNGGISFGGVVAFIFADLIIVPILVIYRKYYGTRMMLFVLGSFYATMVGAGYVVELVFGALGLVPSTRHAKVSEVAVSWNYTTVLNIVFLLVAAGLVVRFVQSGGRPMLTMMGGDPPEPAAPGHHDHGSATTIG